jgi:hypothetical protein
MHLGTAVLILGLIGFSIASPGFRILLLSGLGIVVAAVLITYAGLGKPGDLNGPRSAFAISPKTPPSADKSE